VFRFKIQSVDASFFSSLLHCLFVLRFVRVSGDSSQALDVTLVLRAAAFRISLSESSFNLISRFDASPSRLFPSREPLLYESLLLSTGPQTQDLVR